MVLGGWGMEMDEQMKKCESYEDAFSLIDDDDDDDDDFLFASSSDMSVVDNPGCAGVPMNQPSDSLGLHKPKKTGKCNLRKSLAWDSAFFTNAGVLDPEELSSIIEGAEMGVKQSSSLPCIQEDLSQSTDSISTFQSDLTLESLEADLFCDIRASIQRCNKSSTTGNNRDPKIHGEYKSISGTSTKIVETSARKLAKPKASNRLNSTPQGSVRALKPGPVRKQEKPPVNRNKEPSSSLLRPPKAAGHPNLQVAATTKRTSVSAGHDKQDTNVVGIVKGKASSLPETPRQVNSRKPLPKAPASSKIPTPSSLLRKTAPHTSRSSCDSSSSSTSDNVRKSQTGIIRRKMEKTVNLSSLSKTRTSSKVLDKGNSQNKESRLSTFLKSSSHISPTVSPASSISEWSTESSSSTVTVNQKHCALDSFVSSQDVSNDIVVSRNLRTVSSKRDLGGNDNQVAGVNNQSSKQPSTGSVSNTRLGFAKPSGLRMPSPNIGFFDGVKAGVKTPSSSSRSRTAVPSSFPRSVGGTNSPGTSNKSKLGTSASEVISAGTVKPKQKITDANSKTTALPVDHCIASKTPVTKHTDNGSETSSEFHTSTLPVSALESNTPEVSRLETHDSVPWQVGEDILGMGSDLVAVDISSKSALEKYNKEPESSGTGNSVLDCELVGKDNLACELVISTTEDATIPDLPSPLPKLAKVSLCMSLLEEPNPVTELPVEGEHTLEMASMVNDNLLASERITRAEENVFITTDMGISTAKYQLEGDPQRTNPNLMLTVKTADNDSGSTHELSKSTSQNSASKATEITDGGKYAIPYIGTVVKDGSSVQGKDEISHLNNDLLTSLSEDGSHMLSSADCVDISHAIPISNIKEKILDIVDNKFDLTPQKGDDADNHEGICQQHTLQDEGKNVGPCANDENQCVEIGLAEMKENSYTANYQGEIQEDSHISVQSVSKNVSSIILTSPLPSSGVNLAATIPSAVKNSDLHGIGQHTLQDEVGIVGPCASDRNQCVENGLAEIKEHSCTVNEGKIQEESHISVESLSGKISNLILNSPLPSSVVGPAVTTPLAIKNTDQVRSVGPCANDENQCVENMLADVSKNSWSANYEGEIQEESHTSVQSLSEKFSSLILNSPLPNSVVDPAARTPLAIKNCQSNVVEMSNSLIG